MDVANRPHRQEGVHTSRILFGLRRNLPVMFPGSSGRQDAEDEFEFALEQLAQVGDIVHLGNGYWVPGPTRYISLQSSDTIVVCSGLPTSVLKSVTGGDVHCSGALRYVTKSSKQTVHPIESISEWLGLTETLGAWTNRIVAWSQKRLSAQADVEDDALEVYAPDRFRAQGRLGYWMLAKEFEERERTLRIFRPVVSERWKFDRPEYLGVFAPGLSGSRVTKAVRLSSQTAYRLRFGFDQRLGTPRSIALKQHDNACEFDLKFGLPEPEARVLGFCWRQAGQSTSRLAGTVAQLALTEVARNLGVALEFQ